MRVTQDGKGSIEKQSNQRESPTSATVPRFTLSPTHTTISAAWLQPLIQLSPLIPHRLTHRERGREGEERSRNACFILRCPCRRVQR